MTGYTVYKRKLFACNCAYLQNFRGFKIRDSIFVMKIPKFSTHGNYPLYNTTSCCSVMGWVYIPFGEESWLSDFALSESSSSLLGRMSAISTAMCLHSTSISNLRFNWAVKYTCTSLAAHLTRVSSSCTYYTHYIHVHVYTWKYMCIAH